MSDIMTRQEAAEIVRTFREVMDTPVTEHREILLGALDMAIEELEKERPSVIYLCKYHRGDHECKHTTRIEDALNFEKVAPGKWVEKIPVNIPEKTNVCKNCEYYVNRYGKGQCYAQKCAPEVEDDETCENFSSNLHKANIIDLLKCELECVKRQDTDKCQRDENGCQCCDLIQDTDEIIHMYEEVIDLVEKGYREHCFAPIVFNEEKMQEIIDDLKQKIENGEVYLAPAPVQATVPILIHHSGKTFPGYNDTSRKLIFASSISEELAEQFGWTWEEAEEQKLGG